MASPLVSTVLSLTAVSAVPSPNCLQWTGDGQLLLLTKLAVYILTPDVGISLGILSTAKHTQDARNGYGGSRPVGWLKTIIGFDKALTHHWPVDCQESSSVSLGSLDPVLRAVTASPSNLGVDSGCLLAVLNSNMELTIWGPVKHYLQGEWVKLLDITAQLRTELAHIGETILAKTLWAQTTCVEWSGQADFGLAPTPQVDGSLLAVGNRAGAVTFLKFSGNTEGTWEVRSEAQLQLSDRWITHIAWSTWRPSGSGECEAYVACGAADGSVMLVKVTQAVQLRPSATGLTPDYELKRAFQPQDIKPCSNDGRSVTSMRWFDVGSRASDRAVQDILSDSHLLSQPMLVYSKPGFLHLWSDIAPDGAWSGSRTFPLRTEQLSVGSSALSSVSGTVYIPARDSLIVTQTDGSIHVIHGISVDPSYDALAPNVIPTSKEMSHTSRTVCAEVEPQGLSSKDVNRIYGIASYDDHATYVWAYELCQPTDFSYKHDARHVTMFIMAQLGGEVTDNEFLRDLRNRMARAKACAGEGPVSLLRPFLVHLRDARRLSRLQAGILDLLQAALDPLSRTPADLPEISGELSIELRLDLKRSIAMHLFGWDALLCQRMRFLLAGFCQKVSGESTSQQPFKEASDRLLFKIWHHVLYTMIEHIRAVWGLLSSADYSFVLRVIVQASLPGTTADLVEEANRLRARMVLHVPQNPDASNEPTLDEMCPACHAQIPLLDIFSAVCPNGHVWTRCSITSFILATPMVRTCVGCSRKAFLPPSQVTPGHAWLPDSLRDSWLAIDIVEAARRCFFCGSHFVTLV